MGGWAAGRCCFQGSVSVFVPILREDVALGPSLLLVTDSWCSVVGNKGHCPPGPKETSDESFVSYMSVGWGNCLFMTCLKNILGFVTLKHLPEKDRC